MTELEAIYNDLSDKALLQILDSKKGEYRCEAIKTAFLECQKRGLAIPDNFCAESMDHDYDFIEDDWVNNNDYKYASFYRRLAAFTIDFFVGVPLLAISIKVLTGSFFIIDNSDPLFWYAIILGVVLIWLYFSLMESSDTQATLGKMAVGIKVTDTNGDKISFGRATIRLFAKYISGIFFGVGFFMAAFTEKRQGLHDIIAKTFVITQGFDPKAKPYNESEDLSQNKEEIRYCYKCANEISPGSNYCRRCGASIIKNFTEQKNKLE